MSNLAYAVRLLDCQCPTLMVSIKIYDLSFLKGIKLLIELRISRNSFMMSNDVC